jgi:hypothetical protein
MGRCSGSGIGFLFVSLWIVFTTGFALAQRPWGPEELSRKEKASYLDSAVLAGSWYLNNQNTAENPWGGIHDSADLGRFIYEYFPARKWARGNVVWGQAVGIMGLLSLHARTGQNNYLQSAKMAGEYLKTLQILDNRKPANFGAMREHSPQDNWSFPRDAATGGMGLAALYMVTGDKEYLQRARLLCDWFIDHGMGSEKWPHWTYYFDRSKQPEKRRAYFQVGAGLMFYYVHRLTGEKRYINNGLLPLCRPAAADYHIKPWTRVGHERYDYPWSAFDDFCSIALLAAYRLTGETLFLKAVLRHADWLLTDQASDGSFSSFSAGTYIAALTLLELCRIIESEGLDIDTEPYYQAIHKAARFGQTLQEKDPGDIRSYGGLYGQTEFGLNRDRIHHRVTGYSVIFNVRYEGEVKVPYYSTYGWGE